MRRLSEAAQGPQQRTSVVLLQCERQRFWLASFSMPIASVRYSKQAPGVPQYYTAQAQMPQNTAVSV